MLNRFTHTARDFAGPKAFPLQAWTLFARDTLRGFMTSLHHILMILGVAAIGALALMFVHPEIADQLKALSPFTLASAQEPLAPLSADKGLTNLPAPSPSDIIEARRSGISPVRSVADNISSIDKEVRGTSAADTTSSAASRHQQALVTSWLAKKYRVASDASDMLVSAAYATAKEIKLDPLLILSVMAIESGLNPFAESPVGAQGLMQVMSKVHHEKFQQLGGVKAALNPVANIKVGSLILKDYVTRGGSVEAGLKLYVGAAAFENDFGYGYKVMAEYRRLKDVATGKVVPVVTPMPAAVTYTGKIKPDAVTVVPAAVAQGSKSLMPDPVASNNASMASL